MKLETKHSAKPERTSYLSPLYLAKRFITLKMRHWSVMLQGLTLKCRPKYWKKYTKFATHARTNFIKNNLIQYFITSVNFLFFFYFLKPNLNKVSKITVWIQYYFVYEKPKTLHFLL